MSLTYAYVARGRLFVAGSAESPRELTSRFAEQYEDRQARQQQAHGWKDRGGLWGEFGTGMPFGLGGSPSAPRRIRFGSVARGAQPGELSYLVDFGHMTGLFQQELADRAERRLFHRNDFPARELTRDRSSGQLAMSVAQGDGSSRIAICEADGRLVREVTDGDTVDEAPSWGADSRRLVYQSAAILRNAGGFPLGLGPYAIEEIDLDARQLAVTLEQDGCDCLQPHESADGTLYYIRRPYRSPQTRPSLVAIARDVGLFPYRLLRAFVAYLNVFSVRYTGEPLRTAGGPQHEVPIPDEVFQMWGQRIDPRKGFVQKSDGYSSIVPRDWQLIRRTKTGEETVLASGVLSFDVGEDGMIVYSTGTAVRVRRPDGSDQELLRERFAERITLL